MRSLPSTSAAAPHAFARPRYAASLTLVDVECAELVRETRPVLRRINGAAQLRLEPGTFWDRFARTPSRAER